MTPLNNSFTPCTSFCNIYIHRYPPLHSFLFCSRSGGGVGFCHNYGLVFFISHSKQVTEFLSRNNLLDPNQSGFKSGHSTKTALLSVIEAFKTARAAAQSSVLILLDLSAAFDTVNHRILLSTLLSMGISGRPHSWFESYLTGRSLNVSWTRQLSVPHRLITGLPQGQGRIGHRGYQGNPRWADEVGMVQNTSPLPSPTGLPTYTAGTFNDFPYYSEHV